MWLPVPYLVAWSLAGLWGAIYAIPRCANMLLKANLSGVDMGKRSKPRIPEAVGVVSGCIFLMVTFLMIPTCFSFRGSPDQFPFVQFVQLLAALLSITCMLLLGFADDVLDLRWRHKLLLPTMASLPVLVVYFVTVGRTVAVMPLILRPYIGTTIDLGPLYYVYMGMLAVFCTNAINIYAGINGLEVGQSVIIAGSIIIFNLGEMDGLLGDYHKFSLYLLCPYVSTSLALLYHNWYPANIFPGDTFCYFSGMTLAVVAILGHFSKTLLLFFMPQVFNFLYSLPQLFHQIPCPRHRLPKYNEDTDLRSMSTVVFEPGEARFLGKLCLSILELTGLANVKRFQKDKKDLIECNNLTLINLALKFFGPMSEENLTKLLLLGQVLSSCLAFAIRYKLALLFYGEVVA